jgi:hypothetical protein
MLPTASPTKYDTGSRCPSLRAPPFWIWFYIFGCRCEFGIERGPRVSGLSGSDAGAAIRRGADHLRNQGLDATGAAARTPDSRAQGRQRPINVLSTNSAWLLSSLVLGCNGVLSGSGSVIADLQVRPYRAASGNDLAEALG